MNPLCQIIILIIILTITYVNNLYRQHTCELPCLNTRGFWLKRIYYIILSIREYILGSYFTLGVIYFNNVESQMFYE